ncbi:biotin transport system permease protein [Haloactinospora alba]|uniref:Biotin transport system permease protein n=1 Tax=Haloactinospora alba TaxID=405555 RepID=A0A543NKZ2_9ACTN|nr:energy-coupling factor transporter transmembrane protein EcfT [Haloactinospora alba]TQN32476.1 biotin transport system permease protein [Haloactinospora alba]
MNTVGLYVPGDSVAHRTPAWGKFLFLFTVVTVVLAVGNMWVDLAAALGSAALYPLSGFSVRRAVRLLVPLAWFLAAIVAFQALAGDWQLAARLCLRIVAAVLLSGIVTLSTRVSEMLALFENLARPLAVVGVRPRRVALVLALTIRSIPLVASAWRSSREAYLARGLRRRPHLLAVPAIVALIRSAEAMGEAMSARGIDERS